MIRLVLFLGLANIVSLANAQIVVHESKQASRLHRRLSRPIKLDFGSVSVHEFATALSNKTKSRVTVDRVALEADLSLPNPRVNATIEANSLREALDGILTPEELAWEMHAGTIRITSMENAADLPRVYDVSDLVRKKHRAKDLEMLYEAIAHQVDPLAWPENDDAITQLELRHATVLVISQTEQMHTEILRLLHSLRRANRKRRAR